MADYNPFVVARKSGLNIPDWMVEGIDPALAASFLPGAGVYDSRQMGEQMAEQRRLNNYGTAALLGLGAAGMAASEFLPGILGASARKGIKSGVGLLPVSDYTSAAGSNPRYLGAAPDRSEYTYLRQTPARGVSDRTASAIKNLRADKGGLKSQMYADIRRGEELGGSDWYNTEELRDWFMRELGPEKGHAEWKEFTDLIGATSPASKVEQNIKAASAVRQLLANDPAYASGTLASKTLGDARKMAKSRPAGYGHYAAGGQEMAVARQQRGEWIPEPQGKVIASADTSAVNPKPKGFKQSLIGNPTNIAADLHFTRYMAMASGDPAWIKNSSDLSQKFQKKLQSKYGKKINKYIKKTTDTTGSPVTRFDAKAALDDGVTKMDDYKNEPAMYAEMPNDNEYKAFEEFMNEIGQELGMTGPQVQANLWMGGAAKTGVDDSSLGTFMEILRNRADKRAAEIGSTRSEVLQDFIKNKGLLTVPIAAAGTGGLLMGNEEM